MKIKRITLDGNISLYPCLAVGAVPAAAFWRERQQKQPRDSPVYRMDGKQ